MGWIDPSKISAATARDALERVLDDRTFVQRLAQGTRSLAGALAAAGLSRPRKFTFGVKVKSKAAPRPKPERTAETREYFRTYMPRAAGTAEGGRLPKFAWRTLVILRGDAGEPPGDPDAGRSRHSPRPARSSSSATD